jgi:hypothetical protein
MKRMPSVSLAGPTGAILSGLAGRNSRTIALVRTRAVRPSGILSVTVGPTVILRSVPAFLPGQASTDASLLTVRLARAKASLTKKRDQQTLPTIGK